MYKLLVSILSVTLFGSVVFAQKKEMRTLTELSEKIRYYAEKESQNVLFAHFDKTIYTNNENVWFTAYLLKSVDSLNSARVLSVVLVNSDTKNIAYRGKFAMAEGIGFGNVFLPDTISPGHYNFILYTNQLIDGKVPGTFVQPVTIKNIGQSSLKVSIDSSDIGGSKKEPQEFTVDVKYENKPASGAFVKFFIGELNHPFFSGSGKSNNRGQFNISVPPGKTNKVVNILRVEVEFNKQKKASEILIPGTLDTLSVKFYPEGGYLVNGITSMVGWEVKDNSGSPVQTSAVLFEDHQIVDTVKTDQNGVGKFRLRPRPYSSYSLRLINESRDQKQHSLPARLMSGANLACLHTVVNDTLLLKATSSQTGKFFLIIHNFQQVYFALPVTITAESKLIKIELKDVPRGICEISLLDSLQRPISERLFFAHFNPKMKLNISTNKSVYHTREQVSLKIKIADLNSQLINGLVSVACVQKNRIDPTAERDILSYYYLNDKVGSLLMKNHIGNSFLDDRDAIENILLIRGWRKYNWQQAMVSSANKVTLRKSSVLFTGSVKYFNRPVKNPVNVAIKADSLLTMITTDDKGNFLIPFDNILTKQDKPAHLSVLARHKEDYQVTVPEPFLTIDDSLAKSSGVEDLNLRTISTINTESSSIPGFQHMIHLRQVVIRGTSNNSLYGMNANPCGDYVCVHNILNCPNHRNDTKNRKPVKGEKYLIVDDPYLLRDRLEQKLKPVIYEGCDLTQFLNTISIDGIYNSKEFYADDYAGVPSTEPEYLSTIFWKHLCKVNSDKEIELNFYTSDITGIYKIIVQGISSADVLYATKEIEIK